jgi:DNA-binding Lrp family transcriptional regulator
MDALDRRILREVQHDCSPSAAVLAERCGTTESTALRRLKRLRANGTLGPPHMRVRADQIGRGLKVILSFQLKGESNAELDELRQRLVAHPDVTDLYFVTGNQDYILILTVAAMEDYDRFLRDMILGQPSLCGSQTHVVIKALKVAAPVPIDEPSQTERFTATPPLSIGPT